MFVREYKHVLYSKNRIIVPAKFRESLENKFVIIKGLDSCLYAYLPC